MKKLLFVLSIILASTSVQAQEVAGDSVMQHVTGNRLSVGGYLGESAHNTYPNDTKE